jgi:hypothetical protein
MGPGKKPCDRQLTCGNTRAGSEIRTRDLRFTSSRGFRLLTTNDCYADLRRRIPSQGRGRSERLLIADRSRRRFLSRRVTSFDRNVRDGSRSSAQVDSRRCVTSWGRGRGVPVGRCRARQTPRSSGRRACLAPVSLSSGAAAVEGSGAGSACVVCDPWERERAPMRCTRAGPCHRRGRLMRGNRDNARHAAPTCGLRPTGGRARDVAGRPRDTAERSVLGGRAHMVRLAVAAQARRRRRDHDRTPVEVAL